MTESAKAIGASVRRIRQKLGISQDVLARRVREYGLNWTTSRVSELERGALRLDVSVLLAVTAALNTANQTATHSLAEVLNGEAVPITPSWSLDLQSLVQFLDGEVGALEIDAILPNSERIVLDVEQIARFWQLSPHDVPLREAMEVEARPSTLAERRAAKRLGVSVEIVKLWAHRLWQRTLDEEAAAQASTDSVQARGHATRALVELIGEKINGAPTNSD